MKLTAILRGSSTGDELEKIIQSLEAVNFVETPGDDMNSDSTDSDESSTCSEMTREEYMTVQILTGASISVLCHQFVTLYSFTTLHSHSSVI